MDKILLFMGLAAIICIVVLYIISKKYYTIADDVELILDDDVDMLMSDDLSKYIKPEFNTDIVENNIANAILKKLFCLTNAPEDGLIIGTNIAEQYKTLSKTNIENFIYDPNGENRINEDTDYVFHMRDIIGKNCDIAYIRDQNIRHQLALKNNYDLNELNSLLESGYAERARDYFLSILQKRWEKINKLSLQNIKYYGGSFLYLKNQSDNNSKLLIKMKETETGQRINLLCRRLEFETLLKRLSKLTAENKDILEVL